MNSAQILFILYCVLYCPQPVSSTSHIVKQTDGQTGCKAGRGKAERQRAPSMLTLINRQKGLEEGGMEDCTAGRLKGRQVRVVFYCAVSLSYENILTASVNVTQYRFLYRPATQQTTHACVHTRTHTHAHTHVHTCSSAIVLD